MDEHRSNAGRSVEPLRPVTVAGPEGPGRRPAGRSWDRGRARACSRRPTRARPADRSVRGERARTVAESHPAAVLSGTDDLGAVRAFVHAVEADRYERSRGEPMDVTALAAVAARELRTGDRRTGRSSSVASTTTVRTSSPSTGRTGPSRRRTRRSEPDGRWPTGSSTPPDRGSLRTTETRRTAGRALRSAAERDCRTGVGEVVAEVTPEGVASGRYDSVGDLP